MEHINEQTHPEPDDGDSSASARLVPTQKPVEQSATPPTPWWEEQRPQPAPPSQQSVGPPTDEPPSLGWAQPTALSQGSWYQRRAVIGALIAGLVLAVLILIVGGDDGETPHSEHASTANADQAEIEQLVQTWADNFNAEDLSALESLMCSGSASQLPQNLFPRNDVKGTLSSSVSGITVTGDRATAVVTSSWSGGTNERFENSYAKENGEWRICHTLSY